MKTLKEQIINTGYVSNKQLGGVFHKKWPKLYKEILEKTKDIELTYVINKKLRARVIFLMVYNCDIKKITSGKKWLTFNANTDSFIDKTYNNTKLGWDNSRSKLENLELLPKTDTINMLKNEDYYLRFFGKAKNRTLLNEHPRLYKSILEYTKILNTYDRNTNKLTGRLIYLVKLDGDSKNLICPVCKKNNLNYNSIVKKFNSTCYECFNNSDIKYPQIGYFKSKYLDEWERYYNEDREKMKNLKVNSKFWFTNKYGDETGVTKYDEYSKNRVESIINLKTTKFSKISQEIFWLIYNLLNEEEKKQCFFKELNYEKFIVDGAGHYYFPDFIFLNKIIEYDGKFWHEKNSEKDKLRNMVYKSVGYDLLIINEDDFNRKNKNIKTIERCVNFLKNEK